ncbi:hypothetical protein MRX96_035994 [Rhipicephalus microplus]
MKANVSALSPTKGNADPERKLPRKREIAKKRQSDNADHRAYPCLYLVGPFRLADDARSVSRPKKERRVSTRGRRSGCCRAAKDCALPPSLSTRR